MSIEVIGGGKSCVSGVLLEKSWVEAKGFGDPTFIKIQVAANVANLPRQSNIVLANASQSVTVALVQDGQPIRVNSTEIP